MDLYSEGYAMGLEESNKILPEILSLRDFYTKLLKLRSGTDGEFDHGFRRAIDRVSSYVLHMIQNEESGVLGMQID